MVAKRTKKADKPVVKPRRKKARPAKAPAKKAVPKRPASKKQAAEKKRQPVRARASARSKRPANLSARLVEAVRAGDLRSASRLLDAGAHPSSVDASGASVVALAVASGLPLVRLLIARGASADGPFANGATALHRAVELGSVEIATALLAAGADPRREDDAGMTPLHVAAHRSSSALVPAAMIDLLVEHGAATEDGASASTALLRAADDGQIEHVQRLLAHGAKLDAVTGASTRKTALHLAFERGDDAIARLLIEHGADRSKRDHTGLDLASVYGPWGEDVRPISVHYVPSADLQRLVVKVTLCALHPSHVAHYQREDFDAARWADLVSCGVAGSDLFPPEAGRADAVSDVDLSGVTDVGVYERSLVIDVASVAPAFVALIARALLAHSATLTGARGFAPLRVVGLDIRGSVEGASSLDGATLRRAASERVPLAAYHGEAPPSFALEVTSGQDPALRVVAAGAVSDADAVSIVRHAQAWLATQTTWRTTPDHDGSPLRLVSHAYSPEEPSLPLVRLGKTGDGGRRFPYELASARATLANAMRALGARVPLAEVVLAVPEPIC